MDEEKSLDRLEEKLDSLENKMDEMFDNLDELLNFQNNILDRLKVIKTPNSLKLQKIKRFSIMMEKNKRLSLKLNN